MMKAKKWMALALSAVMAVGMLTGCGGGGTASNRSAMTVSQVNSALRKGGQRGQGQDSGRPE